MARCHGGAVIVILQVNSFSSLSPVPTSSSSSSFEPPHRRPPPTTPNLHFTFTFAPLLALGWGDIMADENAVHNPDIASSMALGPDGMLSDAWFLGLELMTKETTPNKHTSQHHNRESLPAKCWVCAKPILSSHGGPARITRLDTPK